MHPTLRHLMWLLAGALLFASIYFGSEAWKLTRERNALLELDPAERAVLFERHLAVFEQLCADDRGFESWCEREAEFLLEFPECDAACRDGVSRYAPGPSR